MIYSQMMLTNKSFSHVSYLLVKSGAVVTFFSMIIRGNHYIGLLLLHEYQKSGYGGIGPRPPMTRLI